MAIDSEKDSTKERSIDRHDRFGDRAGASVFAIQITMTDLVKGGYADNPGLSQPFVKALARYDQDIAIASQQLSTLQETTRAAGQPILDAVTRFFDPDLWNYRDLPEMNQMCSSQDGAVSTLKVADVASDALLLTHAEEVAHLFKQTIGDTEVEKLAARLRAAQTAKEKRETFGAFEQFIFSRSGRYFAWQELDALAQKMDVTREDLPKDRAYEDGHYAMAELITAASQLHGLRWAETLSKAELSAGKAWAKVHKRVIDQKEALHELQKGQRSLQDFHSALIMISAPPKEGLFLSQYERVEDRRIALLYLAAFKVGVHTFAVRPYFSRNTFHLSNEVIDDINNLIPPDIDKTLTVFTKLLGQHQSDLENMMDAHGQVDVRVAQTEAEQKRLVLEYCASQVYEFLFGSSAVQQDIASNLIAQLIGE